MPLFRDFINDPNNSDIVVIMELFYPSFFVNYASSLRCWFSSYSPVTQSNELLFAFRGFQKKIVFCQCLLPVQHHITC